MAQSRPRRRRKTAAARLRPFWFLLLLLVLAVGFGVYEFATWPGFTPHRVAVNGNQVVTKEQILSAAEINPRTNIWLQNAKAIGKRVAAIPYIDTAEVRRLPPGTVVIDVTERKPFARLKTDEGAFLIDRSLRVLQPDDGSAQMLPIFEDPDRAPVRIGTTLDATALIALRDDEEALTAAGLSTTNLTHDKYGDLVVVLRNGVRVLFGDETDLQKKIRLVDPILTQVGRAGRPIGTIDLRAPNTPVVVYKK